MQELVPFSCTILRNLLHQVTVIALRVKMSVPLKA